MEDIYHKALTNEEFIKAYKNTTPITFCELFSGVAGFSIGLDNASKRYQCVYMNQYEPATKRQHAFEVLKNHFGDDGGITLSNEDINKVEPQDIPDSDLWVLGICCQDYSIANAGHKNVGIKGEKGSLWYQVYRLLTQREKQPKYIIIENVDRLLISPANQRGRDFALILSSLAQAGYGCEWMVINAAEYGFPQRRKRTYVVCYHKSTPFYKKLMEEYKFENPLDDYLQGVYENGSFAKGFQFEINEDTIQKFSLDPNSTFIDMTFNKGNKQFKEAPFGNYGVMIDNKVTSCEANALYDGKHATLESILIPTNEVSEEYYLKDEDIPKWEYQKGAKEIARTSKSGYSYIFKEGAMQFPDALDKPSRTIITSCGSKSPSRFSIVVKRDNGRLSLLTPIEFERLQGFPDDWTKLDGVSDAKRAFFMGNALVTGVITNIGKGLQAIIESES